MNASEEIDKQIAGLPDWRGKMVAHLRSVINQSDPNIKEDWKWGTAVWTANGLVCAVGAFKAHVKINFFKGATLEDPNKLLQAGEGKLMRSIDLKEGETVNETALQELIREAISLNSL